MEKIFNHEKKFIYFGKRIKRDQSHHTMVVDLSNEVTKSYCTILVVFSNTQAEIPTAQHIFQGRNMVEVSRLCKK